MTVFLLKNWQGILGIIGALVLGTLLAIQKGETRHWHKQSDQFEQLYHDEQTALAKTVANYRAAAEAARAADKANAERVASEQKAINERTVSSYETRLADARAYAERLRQSAAAAHPGGPGTAGVPGLPAGPRPAHGPAPEAGLPLDDALVATEQAIQLDELQQWVKSQSSIPVSSPSSSPTGNR